MFDDFPSFNSAQAMLLDRVAHQRSGGILDMQAAYAAARAALYRHLFACCAESALSAADSRALAELFLPEADGGDALNPRVDEQLLYEFSDPRLWGRLHQTLLAHEIIGTPPDLWLTPSMDDRRAQGSYYTPAALTRFIVRQGVGPPLEEKLDALRARWREHFDPDDTLFDFAVLDPALGTGYFLLEALDFITDRLLVFLDEFPAHSLHGDAADIRREVLTHCLYGIDLDPQAVGLARMSLCLAAGTDITHAAALVAHLVPGNALLETDSLLPRARFDAVIGNPPYVPWHAIGAYRDVLESGQFRGCTYRARPHHRDAQPNLYLFFMLLMLDLLRPGGRGCFVLPPEWLSDRRAASFSTYIARRITHGALLRFDSSLRLFDSAADPVGTASLIWGIIKHDTVVPDSEEALPPLDAFTLAETNRAAVFRSLDLLDLWSLDQTPVAGTFHRISLRVERYRHELRPTFEWNIPLITTGDRTVFEIGGGFQPPMALVPFFTLDAPAYHDLPRAEQAFVFPAILHASSITRYCVRSEGRFWIVLNVCDDETTAQRIAPALWAMLSQHRATLEAARGLDWWRFPNPRNLALLTSRLPRLLTPRTAAHNSFALDVTGYLFKGTNAYVRVLPPYDPAYVLALLNSRLLDRYYVQAGQPYHGSARKYEPGKIAHFPIRRIDFTTPHSMRADAAESLLTQALSSDGFHLDDPRAADVRAAAQVHLEAGRADVIHDVLAGLARAQSEQIEDGRDRVINALVEALYGLTDDQIAALDAP